MIAYSALHPESSLLTSTVTYVLIWVKSQILQKAYHSWCVQITQERPKGGAICTVAPINQRINWHRGVIRLAVCIFGNLDVKHWGEGAGYKAGMVRCWREGKKTSGLCSGVPGESAEGHVERRAKISISQLVSRGKDPKDTKLVINYGWKEYGQMLHSSLYFPNSPKIYNVTNIIRKIITILCRSFKGWISMIPCLTFFVERRTRVPVTGMVTVYVVGFTAFFMVSLYWSHLYLLASVARVCLSFHFHPLSPLFTPWDAPFSWESIPSSIDWSRAFAKF